MSMSFAATVHEFVPATGAMAHDCSGVDWVTGSGMRVLETAHLALRRSRW